MAFSSSPQTYLGASLGAFGSTIITGTGIYTGNWCAIRSLDVNFTFGQNISGDNITNVIYFTGKAFSAPAEILGNFTTIQLSTGACQAFIVPNS